MPYRETFGSPWCPCGQILQQCLAEYCRRLYEVGLLAAPARSRENAAPPWSIRRPVFPHVAMLSVCDGSALQEDKTRQAIHRIISSHPVPRLLKPAVRLEPSLSMS